MQEKFEHLEEVVDDENFHYLFLFYEPTLNNPYVCIAKCWVREYRLGHDILLSTVHHINKLKKERNNG